MVELSINSTPSSYSQRNHRAASFESPDFGGSWYLLVKVLLLSHFRQGTFASLELRVGQLLAAKPQGDKAGE